jgi:hypothetical protein
MLKIKRFFNEYFSLEKFTQILPKIQKAADNSLLTDAWSRTTRCTYLRPLHRGFKLIRNLNYNADR